jgi:DNA-binding NtrC family response regulator
MGRLLIVDDNSGLCFLLKEFFEMDGLEVMTCADINGIENRFSEFLPDIGLFDIHVGKGDVLMYLNRLKRLYPDTELVLMSADKPDETFKDYTFIIKPFDIFKLKDLIKKKLKGNLVI